MKNKKLIYLLLPLALLVWGMIIYKIFFQTNAPENIAAFVPNKTAKQNNAALPDTFALLLNYPDPFLKNEKRAVTSTNTTTTQKKPVEIKPQKTIEPVHFPAIKYSGVVKKQEHELAIVSINGSSNFMKTGETVNDITLLRIYNDSIIVSFQNQKRTIKK